MRNGNHYVQARVSPEEKDRLLRICRLSGMPEKLVLLRLMDKKPINERPPEEFWRLRRLLQRIESDVCTLRLSVPDRVFGKYNRLYTKMNRLYCNILLVSIYADPDKRND